ncbi:methyltransferase domain-containing protein [Aliiroseovarius sediminis]|uniref:class I SAM-dependent methyltransferase n=1 Tax=Aliiroseovarius sediminis TaxID=2925839 RepID=UPI001F56F02D|nr:methyltransferase domain-containing protein [Aliiroseovarius sediminis]MCI2395276.1 class I SAM-dependent methyltransferase [Aliiroseovarius sediminis]
MHLDVQDLRNFYYRSMLGRAAQKAIRDKVVEMWQPARTKGQTVAGFGFAVPLLRPYLTSARRVLGLMPAPQGVMAWPAGMKNVSVLVEDTAWPLDTGVVDKLVVMHGLETSETPAIMLQEAYRVLGPGGRALFITPNRAGLWARSDATPFGYGRPYTLTQLEGLLKENGFRVERHLSALHQPPSSKRFWLKTGNFWERVGVQLPLIPAGGVLMVEVSKQIPAPKRPGLAQAVKRPLKVLGGLGAPEPSASRSAD